jgi:hypothetical protein
MCLPFKNVKLDKNWSTGISVSDGKGLDQPACQEEWNKCKKEEE